MGINSILQPYEGGILLGLLIAVIYLIISHRTLKQSIERHDTEQRELRGMVTGLIQSMGDIKQSIGRLEGMITRQQDQTGNKQTPSDGST